MAKAVVGTPGDDELAVALGPALDLWMQFLSELEKKFGPLTREWKKYTATSPWTLRLLQKKRALIYLTPAQPPHTTILLGDKAVAHALADPALLPATAEQIREAKRYPEGTAIRLDVKKKKDFTEPIRLIAAKLAV